jgi:hypothetical protein
MNTDIHGNETGGRGECEMCFVTRWQHHFLFALSVLFGHPLDWRSLIQEDHMA